MQGAQTTIESLQSQVLDLEIKLNQARASVADSRRINSQDTMKLQQQLRQADLKATSTSNSEAGLKALSLEVNQLRSELLSQVSGAAAAAAASQEASWATQVNSLQEKLQHADIKAAISADQSTKLAEMAHERDRLQTTLTQAQKHLTQLESSAVATGEEHRAALQVMHVSVMAAITVAGL